MFMRNQRFAGLKFPDMHRPETLERRFAGHLDPEAMSFLTSVSTAGSAFTVNLLTLLAVACCHSCYSEVWIS